MYNVQKDTRIILLKVVGYDKETKTYYTEGKEKTLKDENMLIQLLVHATQLNHSKNPMKWSNKYIENLMISPNDCIVWYDEYGNQTKYLRQYLFYDMDGKILDIRKYWGKVVKFINNVIKDEDFLNRGSLFLPIVRDPLKPRRKFHHRPKSHAGWTERSISYLHLYKDTYDEEYEYNGHIYTFKGKPKKFSNIYYMDTVMRHSYGWKEKKYKKQWMHNVVEKEKHLKNKEKRQYP